MDLSPGWLLSSLVVSTVGLGLLLYGKKQTRIPQIVAGLLLLVGSMALPSAWMLAGAGLTLGALWAAVRAGH